MDHLRNECKICPADVHEKCHKEYDDFTQDEICGSHFCIWSWAGGHVFDKTTAQQHNYYLNINQK